MQTDAAIGLPEGIAENVISKGKGRKLTVRKVESRIITVT
jgi:hypothetical protein